MKPSHLTLRMYNIGFGDCFLLTLRYPEELADGRRERHLLIDYGSTRKRDAMGMPETGDLIRQHTNGKLDVVIVTHRHKDHLFGFDVDGDEIAALAPDLVVRSWTESPEAKNAGHEDNQAFARSLDAADEAMEQLVAGFGELNVRSNSLRGQLMRAAADAVKNKEAVGNLAALSGGGKGEYLFADETSRIPVIVPGIEVTVLGPPTPEQHTEVVLQREDDEQYWVRLRAAVEANVEAAQQLRTEGIDDAGRPPGPVDWLIRRMDRQQLHLMRRVVTDYDDALNNTSLVLLFTIGEHKLLFAGDAQIENWDYTLQDEKKMKLLEDIDFYKVSHHGSRNGTPKDLVKRWKSHYRSNPGRLLSLMSTLEGVHGRAGHGTEVPRSTLVSALSSPRSTVRLVTTEDVDDTRWVTVQAPTHRKGRYRVSRQLREL